MKTFTFYFLLVASALLPFSLRSQVLAGSASSGLIISYPNTNLSNHVIGSTVSAYFDLDCDSIADLRVDLRKGATAVDGSNTAYLYILNAAFVICSDTGQYGPPKPTYYNQGDTLYCMGNSSWYNDSIYMLGNFGCMDCPGPDSEADVFVAYQNMNTTQVGWIKMSFNLNDGDVGSVPVTMSVPEILSPCSVTLVSPDSSASGTNTCGIFTFDAVITSSHCGQCDGSIIISNMQGGTLPYNYMWSNGVSNANMMNGCGGEYSLDITDANGNTCQFVLTIMDEPGPAFSLSSNDCSCNGNGDGNSCVTNLSGGTAPYSYIWTPGSNSGACSNYLPAGIYTVCVTDANGCYACDTATINEPPPIAITYTVVPPSCGNCCDGEVMANASGGVPPYQYMFDGSGYMGPYLTGSCLTTHTVCVQDANTCMQCFSAYPPVSLKSQDKDAFDIFPNPTKGSLTIFGLSSVSENMKFRLINVLGEGLLLLPKFSVNNGKEPSLQFDLTKFDPGMYFLQIVQDGKVLFIQKIIRE